MEAGKGQVFFTDARGRVRRCAKTSCRTVEILDRGVKIRARRLVIGQYIMGSDQWIEFFHRGQVRYIHSSALTRTAPKAASSPTAPTDSTTPKVIAGATFYVQQLVSVRDCAHETCKVDGVFAPGTRLTALGYSMGQSIDGDDRWLIVDYQGRNRLVPRSRLSETPPTATATDAPPTATSSATDLPTATATVPPPTATSTATDLPTATATDAPPTAASSATDLPTATATVPPPTETSTATDLPTATVTVMSRTKYVVETAGNANANIRACPRTSCEIVAKFAPGAEVDVLGRVSGETVYGTNVWLEIGFEGGEAYIHGALAAAE